VLTFGTIELTLLAIFLASKPFALNSRIVVADSGGISGDVLSYILGLIEGKARFDEIIRADAGCTISSHCITGYSAAVCNNDTRGINLADIFKAIICILLIYVVDPKTGTLDVVKKYRGKMENVYKQYADDCLKNVSKIDTSRIVVADSGGIF